MHKHIGLFERHSDELHSLLDVLSEIIGWNILGVDVEMVRNDASVVHLRFDCHAENGGYSEG